MTRLFSTLAIPLLLLALPCHALEVCGAVGAPLTLAFHGASPFMGFTPPSPNAAQVIVVTVEETNYIAQSAVAILEGNTINVTLIGTSSVFLIPPSCATAAFGPLPAGTYPVNMYLAGSSGNLPPRLFATSTLIVEPAPALLVPGLSATNVAVLSILLLAASLLAVRRDRG